MKITTLALSLSLSLTVMSANAFASKVEFKKGSNDLETQVCYTAAKQGISAAKRLVQANNMNFNTFKTSVMCNGMSVSIFASKYAKARMGDPSVASQTVKVVALSALNQSPESQLCLDAVTMGEKQARVKHSMRNARIECNGEDISDFLESFKNMKVVQSANESETLASL